ncbi:MAG: hypothetical protein LBS36_13310 [Oscillospiraceae bacterium]|nr:hypothetical protein [Oscillospiraceae bacterium]
MLNYVLYFFASLLLLTGVICVIYFTIMRLLTPRRRQSYVVILPLTEENNPVSLLGAALEKRNICGEINYCEIIAVDFGMNGDTRDFVQTMYAQSDRFTLCDYSDMHAAINEKLLTSSAQKMTCSNH